MHRRSVASAVRRARIVAILCATIAIAACGERVDDVEGSETAVQAADLTRLETELNSDLLQCAVDRGLPAVARDGGIAIPGASRDEAAVVAECSVVLLGSAKYAVLSAAPSPRILYERLVDVHQCISEAGFEPKAPVPDFDDWAEDPGSWDPYQEFIDMYDAATVFDVHTTCPL
jgi:hypothetical protein